MPSFRHVIPFAALLGVTALGSQSTFAQSTGWTYTMRIDTDSGQGAAHRTSIAMQYRTTSHKFRSEYVQATGSMESIEGMYQIFSDADSSLTVVTPSQHTAMVMNLPGALAMTGGMKIGPRHITSSDLTDLGPAEKILGHATRRYHMAVTGTMEWTMMGQRCVQPLDTQMDTWIAADVDLGAAMGSMTTMSGLSGATTGLNADAQPLKLPKGASLRSTTKSTHVDAAGVARTIATTMEIIELKYGALPNDAFIVPGEYRKDDMRKMMTSMPTGMMDSVMRSTSKDFLEKMCGGTSKP